MNPVDDLQLIRVGAASTAGTSAVNGTIVDLNQIDDFLFVTTFGTPNAANNLKLQAGAKSDGSDFQDVAGSKVTPTGSGPATVFLGVSRIPFGSRYARVVATRGVSTTLGEIYAVLIHKKRPQTNIDNTNHFGKSIYDAAYGTA